MHIPKPPWYGELNRKLGGSEWLVNTLLVGVILICILLLLRGDRLQRTAFLVYLLSP